jgi:hypothetical protein
VMGEDVPRPQLARAVSDRSIMAFGKHPKGWPCSLEFQNSLPDAFTDDLYGVLCTRNFWRFS